MKGEIVKTIEVLPVGSKVRFIDEGRVGIVTQVCIQADEKVSYEVAWWSGGTRNIAWVSAVEISPESPAANQRIGFVV